MANRNIAGLDALSTTPENDDLVAVYDTSASTAKKYTYANLQGNLDHDLLTGFVANEHINHTGVTITAGAGLSGGGTIAETRTLAVDIASQTTITPVATDDLLLISDTSSSNALRKITPLALSASIDHDSLLNFTSDEHFTQANITTVGTISNGVWNGTAITGQYGGTGVSNTGKTITLGGNIVTAGSFTTAGAFAMTLTSTAVTNVTLPTSGILATLSGFESLTNKSLTSPKVVNSLVFDLNNDVTIQATDPSSIRTYTIPDAGNNASFVMTEGAQTINGIKTFGSFPITPSSAPSTDYQVANKAYVDASSSGIKPHNSCTVATISALPTCTYNNGTGGIGATLTADANGSLNDTGIDGNTSLNTSMRVLVKNQSSGLQNGCYEITDLGGVSSPWILTRVTDFDEASSTEIISGALFPIISGSTLANSQWTLTTTGIINVGTTSLTFTQYGSSPAYTASLGVQKVGNDFRLNYSSNQGIKLNSNSIEIDYDNSTIGIVSNKLAVKSSGITNSHIDFNTIDLDDINDGTAYSRIQIADVTSNRITSLGTINSQLNISYDTGGTEDPADAVIKVVQTDGSQDDYAFAYYDSGTPATLLSSMTFIGDMTLSGLSQFSNSEDDSTEGGAAEIFPLALACNDTGQLTYSGSVRSPLHLQNEGAGYGGDGTGEYFLTARKADTGALDWYVTNLNVMYLNGNLGLGVVPSERLHVKNATANSAPAIRLENDAQAYKLVVDGSDSDKLKLQDVTNGNSSVLEITPNTKDILFNGNIDITSSKNITSNGSNPKRSIVLTARGATPSTTSGCSEPTKVEIGTINKYFIDFDKDSIEYAEWDITMPESYDGGTITAVINFTHASGTNGQSVVWGVQGISYNDGDAISSSWGTAQEVTKAVTVANANCKTSSTSAITLSGTPSGGSNVQIRVYRKATDSSDTLSADARLLNIKLKYSVNSITD